jgi:hypothetical protein
MLAERESVALNLIDSFTASLRILTTEAEITPERIDFVGDEIVAAVRDIDILDDFEHVRIVARAAIQADAEFRAEARS